MPDATSGPLRVAIADDEPLGRAGLRYLLERHPGVEIVAEACDGRDAIAQIERTAPDLLLLDVQMPELDGFGVLAALPAEQRPTTIFVTAHDRFAVRAFETHALDYLLKPVDEGRFDAALARVRKALAVDRAAELGRRMTELLAAHTPPAAAPATRLLARLGERSTVISVADIDWIEAQDYCSALHVGAETHVMRQSLSALEAQLDPRRFVRVHRSALVNVDRVRELDHADPAGVVVVLWSGARLTVSRRRRAQLERVLGPIG